MASKAENEIRQVVVDWFHENEPSGRVVHEIKVADGRRRADLGVIFTDFMILIEIKSKNDVLKRLEDQFVEFQKHSNFCLMVVDEKHFDGKLLKNQSWMRYAHESHLWKFPNNNWSFCRYGNYTPPASFQFLNLLWNEELKEEMIAAGLETHSGQVRWQMVRDLEYSLTGKKVREAVCRQLRKREFHRADPPIFEYPKA